MFSTEKLKERINLTYEFAAETRMVNQSVLQAFFDNSGIDTSSATDDSDYMTVEFGRVEQTCCRTQCF